MKREIAGIILLVVASVVILASNVLSESISVTKVDKHTSYQAASPSPALNQDPKAYQGMLKVYIVEPISRWTDYNDTTYYNGFLDFAIDTSFTIPDDATFSKTVVWDAAAAGYPDVTEYNLKAIAVLFNMSQSYPASADTAGGTGAPFDAYYVDAVAAATVEQQWPNVVSGNYTHSVFIDEATGTYCPNCPTVNRELHKVETILDMPFHYAAMVIDENAKAYAWVDNHYNLHWVPSCFYDGGYIVRVGAETFPFIASKIQQAGERPLNAKFGMEVELNWLGKSEIEVVVTFAQNDIPGDPATPDGATQGVINTSYDFSTSAADPNGNQVYYRFMWEAGDTSSWQGPYDSDETCVLAHSWATDGEYEIKAQAKDSWGFEGGWSAPLSVKIYSYVAGDVNGNGAVNILDVTYGINFLYKGGPAPNPMDALDANGNGDYNLLDLTYLINYLYKGGPAPVYPE